MKTAPHNSWPHKLARLLRDDSGETTVEYALLLAGLLAPITVMLAMLLKMLIDHYRMLTFVETLPLP